MINLGEHLDNVINRFNIPFGKSVRDKIFCLQNYG